MRKAYVFLFFVPEKNGFFILKRKDKKIRKNFSIGMFLYMTSVGQRNAEKGAKKNMEKIYKTEKEGQIDFLITTEFHGKKITECLLRTLTAFITAYYLNSN